MTRGVICASCKADEYSYTNGPGNNSVYTAFLLDGIENRTADPDCIVSAEELHNYADTLTHTYQSEMNPQLQDNYSGDLNLHKHIAPQNLIITNNYSIDANPQLQ